MVASTRLQRGLRATFTGIAVNLLLAGGKLAAGVLGHSNALIADAVESLADLVSSVIVWRGLLIAAAPADKDHPYGHGKAEPLAAALVATLLLLAAAGIGLHSVRGAFTARASPRPFTLLVLLAVVLIKESLYRFVMREGMSMDSTAVRTDAWHHRSDAVTSLAAAFGIGLALLGGPGYAAADDVAALVAAGIIAWNAWRLLRPALDELMDTSPSLELSEQIRRLAGSVPGVHRVEKCLARKMGYQYYVDMHIEVEPDITVLAAHDIAHRVKDQVRARLPQVRDVLVHVEPRGRAGAAGSTNPTP